MARSKITVWIDETHAGALKILKERDGIPEAEQVRRALTAWFETKGIAGEGHRRRLGAKERKGR